MAKRKRGVVASSRKKRDRISHDGHWLTIGEVADLSEMPVKTIRYYEEIGLLEPTTTRSQSGYRLFNTQMFNRLACIKRAQSVGLSLSQIQSILEIHDSGHLPCGAMKERLLHKVNAIAEQIEALEILKSELVGLLSGWQEQPPSHRIAKPFAQTSSLSVAIENRNLPQPILDYLFERIAVAKTIRIGH